jgi:hypothetical protein
MNNETNEIENKINNKLKAKIDYTKDTFTKEEQELIKKEISVIMHKYENYVPVIVKVKDKKFELVKNKYLIHGNITIAEFLCILRKKFKKKINPTEGIYIFINNTIPCTNNTLELLYNINKDKNTDMLFVTICKENTFG